MHIAELNYETHIFLISACNELTKSCFAPWIWKVIYFLELTSLLHLLQNGECLIELIKVRRSKVVVVV